MSIFLLKLVAIVFMLVDHIKYAFPTLRNFFTLYFGRIAFPIFAFCAVQAYTHTRDIKKYLIRLFVAGLISEIPFLLFESLPTIDNVGLNIEFTLFLGIMAALVYDEFHNNFFGLIFATLFAGLGEFAKVDYGFFGVALVFSFSIFKDSKAKTFLAAGLVISAKYIYRLIVYASKYGGTHYYIWNWVFTLLPLLLILLYNGKKGKGLKWFFYAFYPVHLLLLYFLSPLTYNLLNL